MENQGILLSRQHLRLTHNPAEAFRRISTIMQSQCPVLGPESCLVASKEVLVEHENFLRRKKQMVSLTEASPDWGYLLTERQRKLHD